MEPKHKKFRHSSTFYRKLNNIRDSEKGNVEISQTAGRGNLTEASASLCQNDCPSTSHNNENISDNESLIQNVETDYDGIQHAHYDDSKKNIYDENTNKLDFKYKLAAWALKNQIHHNALNELLDLLKQEQGMNFLPKDSRTLLQTPRKCSVIPMGSGHYWYNGLENDIKNILSNSSDSVPESISLKFNIDGIPIAESSKNSFWPILCKIEEIPNVFPIVIAIYYGNTKPPVNDYLEPFVNELLRLLKDGIIIENSTVNIEVRCFICDTPARCFVKGTASFNSYHGCMKCTSIGEFDRKGRHMSYPRTDMPPRTDESFRNQKDPDHHKQKTAVEALPIDMVKDFVIADSLHLLDLGVMKRCLLGWANGSYNYKSKWSAKDIDNVSQMLMCLKECTPSEVHQERIRGLDSLNFWKAAEFKNFLLYFGPVILKDILSFEIYQHFLTLFCAVTICYSEAYKPHLNIAQKLFENYIEKFAEIYGNDSISSNIHNLCHVVNDVASFGPLPTLTAYPFESMLFRIKNLIRSGKLPLNQVANRIQELNNINNKEAYIKTKYPIVKHECVLATRGQVFETVYLSEKCTLANNRKDKWFLTKDNEIVCMEYAIMCEGEIQIVGNTLKSKSNFFERPFNSSHINIYECSLSYETEGPKTYNKNDIKSKLIAINIKNKIVYLPILSTLQY